MVKSFRPYVSLRNRSVLIYVTISSVVPCSVGMLGLFLSLVPKLDCQYKGVMLCRVKGNESSLIPILRLVVPLLRSSNFSRRRSNIYWRMLKFFRVRFGMRRLLLYHRGLSQKVRSMVFPSSFSFFAFISSFSPSV